MGADLELFMTLLNEVRWQEGRNPEKLAPFSEFIDSSILEDRLCYMYQLNEFQLSPLLIEKFVRYIFTYHPQSNFSALFDGAVVYLAIESVIDSEPQKAEQLLQKLIDMRYPNLGIKPPALLTQNPTGKRELISSSKSKGAGLYSQVYKFTTDTQIYAQKIFKFDKDKFNYDFNLLEIAFRETILLKFLAGKNPPPQIIRLHEAYLATTQIMLILEYANAGDLANFITHSETKPIAQKNYIDLMSQLLTALIFLHNLNIIHRDIKPANILLNRNDDQELTVKLADWGAARHENYSSSACDTTYFYASPKSLLGTEPEDEKDDVYSVTLVMYDLVKKSSGNHAYSKCFDKAQTQEINDKREKAYQNLHQNYTRPNLTDTIAPPEHQELIKKGWALEPKDRPTAAEFKKALSFKT